MQQLMYVRPVTYEEGRARGMRAYEVKNGPLRFGVMADKCLDITDVSFLGHNVSFLAKPGLMGRSHYDTNGAEAQRSIMGGMLFTCGLENICAPCRIGGRDYPMHGRIRTTPAEHVGAKAYWDGDDYIAEISGTMREAELFGENLVLRRRVTTRYGENKIYIEDTRFCVRIPGSSSQRGRCSRGMRRRRFIQGISAGWNRQRTMSRSMCSSMRWLRIRKGIHLLRLSIKNLELD